MFGVDVFYLLSPLDISVSLTYIYSIYWRAGEASEVLYSGVKVRIGDICLYVCVWTYVCHFCTLTLAFLC